MNSRNAYNSLACDFVENTLWLKNINFKTNIDHSDFLAQKYMKLIT